VAVSDVITWAKAQLESVPGIGRVYDYEPRAEDLKGLVDAYAAASGQPLLFWLIGQGAITERWETSANALAEESLVITGYYSRSGAATEKTQRDLVESIRTQLRTSIKSDPTLGGLVRRANFPAVAAQEFVDFMGVLCHRVRITLSWERQINT